MFVPSKYQQDFFDEVKSGTGNVLLSALAGAAKTTSIVEAIKYLPNDAKILFLAFNKSIANELTKRVP